MKRAGCGIGLNGIAPGLPHGGIGTPAPGGIGPPGPEPIGGP